MEIVFVASGNAHKVKEFENLLASLNCKVVGLPPGIPPAIEDGATFLENARKKAVHYANYLDGYVLADDSGIAVDALGGQPGIFSARYAGTHGDDRANNEKLLRELSNVSDMERTAEFVCALVLHNKHTGEEIAVEGRVSGIVLRDLQGQEGFGYDPLFYIPSLKKTFAEMTLEEKNRLSHRARAVQALIGVWEESRDADLYSK